MAKVYCSKADLEDSGGGQGEEGKSSLLPPLQSRLRPTVIMLGSQSRGSRNRSSQKYSRGAEDALSCHDELD